MANSLFLGHAISGSKTVATAGTAVALGTETGAYTSVVIVAKDNNTGRIYVGGADVASTTNRGLGPGDSLTVSSKHGVVLTGIYLNASVSGEGVDFYATY